MCQFKFLFSISLLGLDTKYFKGKEVFCNIIICLPPAQRVVFCFAHSLRSRTQRSKDTNLKTADVPFRHASRFLSSSKSLLGTRLQPRNPLLQRGMIRQQVGPPPLRRGRVKGQAVNHEVGRFTRGGQGRQLL